MDAAVVQDAAAAQFGRADAELKERSAPDVIVVENLHQASHLIRSRRSGSKEAEDPELNFAAAAFVYNGIRACNELI